MAALALVACVVGAFVASDSADVDLTAAQARKDAEDAEHPTEWDERVERLVTFVERRRGLEFEHPVQVDFLTPEEFRTEIGETSSELTDEELEEIQDTLPMMRALGLMEGDFDLLDAMMELRQAGWRHSTTSSRSASWFPPPIPPSPTRWCSCTS